MHRKTDYPIFSHEYYGLEQLYGAWLIPSQAWVDLSSKDQLKYKCEENNIHENLVPKNEYKNSIDWFVHYGVIGRDWREKQYQRSLSSIPLLNFGMQKKDYPSKPPLPKEPTLPKKPNYWIITKPTKNAAWAIFILLTISIGIVTVSLMLSFVIFIVLTLGIYLLVLLLRTYFLYRVEIERYSNNLHNYNLLSQSYQQELIEYNKKIEEYKIIVEKYNEDYRKKEKEEKEEADKKEKRNLEKEINDRCLEKRIALFANSKDYTRINNENLLRNLKRSLLNDNYTIAKRTEKRGPCVSLFIDALQKIFHKHVFDYVRIIDSDYTPAVVIMISEYNIKIDIEIDEPYDLSDRLPIHLYGNKDDSHRDQYFKDNKWFVIRFAEEQVVKDPLGCCKYLAEKVSDITLGKVNFVKGKLSDTGSLNPLKRWDLEMANFYMQSNYRETYLKLIGLKTA